MELKEYAWGFLIAGLFLVSIFSFIFVTVDENSEIPTMETDAIDLDNLESSLESSQAEADSWLESFSSEDPLVSYGSLILFSIIGVVKLVVDSIIIFFNIIIGGISSIFGIPPIVTGTLSAMLLIGLIFAGWKTIKQG